MSGASPLETTGDPPEALVWAERYAELGWHVFPVHSNRGDGRCTCGKADCDSPGKHPRTKHGLKDATTDPDRIRRWGELWRNSNIGVATGPSSGIAVIDIDDERAFEALVEQYGPLPATVEQRTGRGRQLVFRYPANCTIRNKTRLDGRTGVDVRGQGGYVVVPPSRHINGKAYAWEWSSDPTDGAAVAELPTTWLELLTAPSQKTLSGPEEHTSVLCEGQRNDQLFRSACAMRARGMSQGAIRAALTADNMARCKPRLSDAEIHHIVASAARYEPGAVLKAQASAPATEPYRPFPVDALPQPVNRFVNSVAGATGTDWSWSALAALAALAGCIGNRVAVSLKSGWTEPAVLWAGLVGKSGSIKSVVLRLVIRPLVELFKAERDEFSAKLREYNVALERHQIELARWKAEQKTGPPTDAPLEPEKPREKRILASDVTVEKLAALLGENPAGLLVVRDELAGLVNSFNRYAGGKGSDLQSWLSMNDAGPLLVDRKSDGSTFVERASVSLLGTIQPFTLQSAFGILEREAGLLARVLLAFPPDRPALWTDAELPDDVATSWRDLLAAMLSLEPARDDAGRPRPRLIGLADDARSAFIEWHDRHARELADLGDDHLRAHWSKLKGACARIALLLACVEAIQGKSVAHVSCNGLDRAIQITEWLKHESARVYSSLCNRNRTQGAQDLADWIAARGGSVTVRDVAHGIWAFHGNTQDARDALESLVRSGAGRWVVPPPGPQGGRPAERFELSDAHGITITETPSDDAMNEGSGDGDVDEGLTGDPNRDFGPAAQGRPDA